MGAEKSKSWEHIKENHGNREKKIIGADKGKSEEQRKVNHGNR